MKTEIVNPETLRILDQGPDNVTDVYGGEHGNVWVAMFYSANAARHFVTYSNTHARSWEGEVVEEIEI